MSNIPLDGAFAADILAKHRFKARELLPFLALAVIPVFGPEYYALATQIIITIVFAISLDLIIGYAGVVTLGHALFFGLGAYATGVASVHGWGEPLTGLVIGASFAAAIGAILGFIILRTSRFTLLMLTLSASFLGSEIANKFGWLTGGVDGLSGVSTWPVFGLFDFDFFGQTGFFYAAGVLLVVWLAMRWLVHAPFGQAIMAIRDNPARAQALGMAVMPRLVLVYTISCAFAGVAGALQAEINQFVGLKDIGFEMSASILVMLILGGTGRIYGAFIGPAAYMVVQDYLAKDNPVLWQLWLGILVVVVVLFLPGGILGLSDKVRARFTS